MLTSKIQYNAARKVAAELQAAIDAPVKDGLSTKIVEANQRKLKNKLESIKAEIAHYENLETLSVEEIEFDTIAEMMSVPILYRLIKHESIADFAKKVGVSARQVSRYEADEYKSCPAATLTDIFQKIGVNIHGKINA